MNRRANAGMRRDEAQRERRRLYVAGSLSTAGLVVGTAADAAAQRAALGLGTAAVEDSDAFAALGGTLVIENRTSDPGAPVSGQLWLRTDL